MNAARHALTLLVFVAGNAMGAQPLTEAEQLRVTPITVQKLTADLHVLFGVGGNILVSIGPQGVLTVDSQFAPMVPKYKAAIRELGGKAIDITINTHGHFDHVDGNTILGPDGTRLIAHENARAMMGRAFSVNLVIRSRDQQAYPAAAWPTITYDREMRLHFNGKRIDLVHVGPAHTTGDTAVIFRDATARPLVVHMGDVYNNAGYPFIDADNGGDLNGVIKFCEAIVAQIDASTIVVPGHGPVVGYQDLVDYIAMLTAVRDRISALIATGATLDQVVAAKPTAPWDEKKGNPAGFVNRAYTTLKRL
jgi:glyoxylase-like metal-dependent hydrolase (beta-lactamase superfamily II)